MRGVSNFRLRLIVNLDEFNVWAFDNLTVEDAGLQVVSTILPYENYDLLCAASSFLPQHPTSTLDNLSLFYLQYHSEKILSAHYFRTLDRDNALCKTWLPAMAQGYPSLQHALIAFSALIYSLKKQDMRARRCAFLHYSLSLKELQKLVDTFPFGEWEYHAIVATSLQLACLDVSILRS
jgi:hypothetical protein